jgi:hypothetical protein
MARIVIKGRSQATDIKVEKVVPKWREYLSY